MDMNVIWVPEDIPGHADTDVEIVAWRSEAAWLTAVTGVRFLLPVPYTGIWVIINNPKSFPDWKYLNLCPSTYLMSKLESVTQYAVQRSRAV